MPIDEDLITDEDEQNPQGLGLVEEDESTDLEESTEEKPKRPRNSPCPENDDGHDPIPNPKKGRASVVLTYDPDYVCRHCGKSTWTKTELEELITNRLLREDANRELCRQCLDKDPSGTPYGDETGRVEWTPQFTKDGEPELDNEGDLLYVAYPELQCPLGHRWYLGEGPRRDIRGKNPILFEPHLYNRKRRELLAKEGVVDPAYTMDRWGKRPTTGLYGRSHPQGRKVNSPKQRKDHGAGFYK
jgi:hypothetical protein